MKNDSDKKYVTTAIYIVIIAVAGIIAVFLLLGARDFFVNKKYLGVLKIMAPFTFGFIIAYLLNPFLIFFENKVFAKIGKQKNKKNKDDDKNKSLRHILSIIATYISAALIITMLVSMVVPQIGASVNQLAAMVSDLFSPYESELNVSDGEDIAGIDGILNPTAVIDAGDGDYAIDTNYLANLKIGVYISNFAASAQDYIDSWGIHFDIEETFNNFFMGFAANILDLTARYIAPAFNATASILLSTASWIFNILLGVVISIYMLFSKDKLIAQIKKLVFALFPKSFADKSINITRKTHEIFGGFITGKIVDSFIIGVICFVCMSIFNIRYAVLISTIVGVTNIIPFFGPFIGAVPSIFFLMINDFWQSVWFLVFVIILQQVDGNIIGPKILGSSIGLSSFWIIFSILVMNGLLGPLGMFIGVPLFALIYTLVKEFAEYRLSVKELPVETVKYILDKDSAIESVDRQESHLPKQKNFIGKFIENIETFSKKVVKYINRSERKTSGDSIPEKDDK